MAAAAAGKPTSTTARPDRFGRWLEGQGEKLRTAYTGLVSLKGPQANHLTPAVAQAIVKHVAGKPEREALLFTTRHQIGITKEAVKDRAGYSRKQLEKVFKREFR